MEEFFKKIVTAYKNLSLTERERISMRLHLAALIDEHPAQAPLMVRASGSAFSTWDSIRLHFQPRFVSAMIVFVLVAGVGTSYAAAGALPGSPLYSLKVSLDEPVERVTVSSSQSDTQWQLTLANRRLQEAEKLATTGTLTPSNAKIVVAQLNTDTQNFNATVSTLATSSLSSVQVANAQSDLDAALSAHVQVLAAIASTSESLDSQVAPVLAVVRAHASVARAARSAALADLSAQSSSTIKVAANGEMAVAVSKLKTMHALTSSTKSVLAGATLAATIDSSTTEAAIEAGNTHFAQGNYQQAFEAFQSAVQTATQAQVGAQAQANLGTSVLVPPIVSTPEASSTNATGTVATTTPMSSSSASSTDPTGKANTSNGK